MVLISRNPKIGWQNVLVVTININGWNSSVNKWRFWDWLIKHNGREVKGKHGKW